MAIDKKLIHFKTWNNFISQNGVNGNWEVPSEGSEEGGTAIYGQIKGTSIVFIKDVQKIWTHGQLYGFDGGSGEGGYSEANVQAIDDEGELDEVTVNKFVMYIAQSLSEEEKAQARENIGITSQGGDSVSTYKDFSDEFNDDFEN